MSEHLRLPLTIGPDGTFRTLREDSVEEITQNILVVLRTRTGERLATPELGTPDPVFNGLDTAAALDVVTLIEPRADLEVVRDALEVSRQSVTLSVRRREST